MSIINLFSKRQKKLRGEISDVYTYDDLPQKLRVQITQIINDAIGTEKMRGFGHEDYSSEKAYQFIHKSIIREYGVYRLAYHNTDKECIFSFFLETKNVEEAIDIVELSFKYIDKKIRENNYEYTHYVDVELTPDKAIEELNHRFKEHSIGYQYEGGEIIKVDSSYAHSEIVKPTINLLHGAKFSGANEEFLKAHEHYRHGRNKECLTECLKAFESVMKIICTAKGWGYVATDNARKLIQICFQNELVPTFTQNQFTSLQNSLESGVPTIRNKLGSHGQGSTPQKVDDEMTRYCLNLTGANIIFLIEQSGIK